MTPAPSKWLCCVQGPSVLALDAPLVAVSWQLLFAHQQGLAVPRAATVALAMAVWCVYLLDRLGDGASGMGAQARHRFAQRWPRLLTWLAVLAAVSAVGAARLLPGAYWLAGSFVALWVASYLILVHHRPRGLPPGLKELAAGCGFAAGVFVPLLLQGGTAAWLQFGLFALVCWGNCRLIDRWEGGAPLAPWERVALAVTLVGCACGSLALLLALGWLGCCHWFAQRGNAALMRAVVDFGMAVVALVWCLVA